MFIMKPLAPTNFNLRKCSLRQNVIILASKSILSTILRARERGSSVSWIRAIHHVTKIWWKKVSEMQKILFHSHPTPTLKCISKVEEKNQFVSQSSASVTEYNGLHQVFWWSNTPRHKFLASPFCPCWQQRCSVAVVFRSWSHFS